MDIGITRTSYLHKALQLLNLAPRSLTEIKRLIGYKKSIEQFQDSVMNVLSNAGMIRRKDSQFFITPNGEAEIKRLGVVADKTPSVKTPHRIANGNSTAGLKLTHAPVRPGADDHMKYPSRRGDHLFYRDGREGVV